MNIYFLKSHAQFILKCSPENEEKIANRIQAGLSQVISNYLADQPAVRIGDSMPIPEVVMSWQDKAEYDEEKRVADIEKQLTENDYLYLKQVHLWCGVTMREDATGPQIDSLLKMRELGLVTSHAPDRWYATTLGETIVGNRIDAESFR